MKLLLAILAVSIVVTETRFRPYSYRQRLKGVSLPKCRKYDPNLEGCLVEGIEKLRPFLRDGIPEINMPALEPFRISRLKLDAHLPGINLNGVATGIKAYGALNFKIESLMIDIQQLVSSTKVRIPRLEVSCSYSTAGSTIMGASVNGTGKFNGIFEGVVATVSGIGAIYKKQGIRHIKVLDIAADISFENSELNVIPNKTGYASKAASSVIHSKSNMIMRLLRSSINKQAAPIIQQYVNQVLAAVPIDDVIIP